MNFLEGVVSLDNYFFFQNLDELRVIWDNYWIKRGFGLKKKGLGLNIFKIAWREK